MDGMAPYKSLRYLVYRFNRSGNEFLLQSRMQIQIQSKFNEFNPLNHYKFWIRVEIQGSMCSRRFQQEKSAGYYKMTI